MKQIFTSTIIGITLATSGICHAQDADNLMSESISLMEKNNWQGALDKVSKVIEANGEKGVKTLGPKFGVAYYYQGLCQLKLAQQARKESKLEEATAWYKKSIESLQQCYAIENTEAETIKGNANNYRIKALMLQGNAQQAINQFDEAIKSYQKFLLERNNIRDSFDVADFNINLAICYWKSGAGEKDAEAEKLYLRAIKAKYRPATTRSKLTGLRAMIESYSSRNKQASVENFMRTNRQYFSVSLDQSIDALPYVSALTLEAAQLNLLETVTALTKAIPSEQFKTISESNKERIEKFQELYAGEELEIDSLEIDDVNLDGWKEKQAELGAALSEAEQLASCARAIVFEKEGYYRGALATYQLLLERDKSDHRADYLYNASRLGLLSSDAEQAFQYGSEFLSNHADHPYVEKLRKQLMLTFYFSGEYKKCVALGEKSPVDNIDYSFTMAGSYYYLGKFRKAEAPLKYLRDNGEENPYSEISDYLYASTLGKLQRWKESINLLDKYIASNPKDQTYIPFAKYDKAFALYSQQKYAEAKAELAPFLTGYKNSVIQPEAHILLGNIYSLDRERTKAETAYRAAILAAKRVNNQHAKEEAYYLAISLLGQRTWDGLANPQLLDTIPLLEDFLKEPNAEKSPYFIQIITSSFDALERAKRKGEAYDKLEEAIFLYNQKPNTPGTDSAIKTYTIAKRKEEISDEEVIATLQKSKYLKNIPYHAGLLLAIELEVLELSQKLSPKDDRAEKIKQLYLNLHVEHDIQLLDNFVLVKVAEFMKENGGIESDTNVKQYYQAVLDSGSKIKRPQAFVGLATEMAKSDKVADREAAVKQFETIINDPFTLAKPKAAAHYQLIEILYAQKNYAELTKQIKAYLKYPSSVKDDIRRVEMLLAVSYDKQNLSDKAIGAYNAVWVNSFENLDQSAPAIDRITDLIWERNNPAKVGLQDGKSDKQLAYETAYKYIRRTKKHYNNIRPKMTEEGIQAWERTREKIRTFEADKEVKAF